MRNLAREQAGIEVEREPIYKHLGISEYIYFYFK